MLDAALQEKISSVHTHLVNNSKLLPRSELDKYYSQFRVKFGPDVLQNLDGLTLLELMHDHSNREGLAYWLEFKNDEEFPAIFGSIAGGSALKFIVFRRAETGEWATRDAHNAPMTISEDEAVRLARNHRDQLVAGSKLLDAFPSNATLADYEALQGQMGEIAPDVSRLGWGHKYFSLLHSTKLDDYHSPYYQRFHLMRLLQNPPEGDTRYIPAWWFVQIANELQMPMNHLTTVLNQLHGGKPYKYWRIGTTDGANDNDFWPEMRAGSFVAIGWPELGDLSGFESGQEVEAHTKEMLPKHYPAPANIVSRKAGEIRRFCNVGNYDGFISEGDIVVAANGMTVKGIGRVVGPYEYQEGAAFPHRRSVEWLSFDEWKMPEQEGLRTTVFQLKRHNENLIEIERRKLYATPIEQSRKPEDTKRTTLPRLEDIPEQIQGVLSRKGQVILYGPPGTGKTFWAYNTAFELAARKSLGDTFIDKSVEESKTLQLLLSKYVWMCTFHPAYGYEDFIEGYRPEMRNEQMVFERRSGVFRRLCEDAAEDTSNNYYLIVDEINRGDIPRIFGELLTILEKNKRGKSIILSLSNELFSVPANVFVIGTMNTADRSIALLDTALRRRFGFIELMPNVALLEGAIVANIPLDMWLGALNQRIVEAVGRDARNLQIGHAYLMDARGRPVSDLPHFKRILREDIIPLLEEYCYEDYAALKSILGEGIIDEMKQRVKYEIFDAAQEDALIAALLQLTPEITTSGKAMAVELEDDDSELDEVDEEAE